MSLRKQAKILGISPSYLSMLVNGKRKWPDDLSYRYQELVNSVVNTERKAAYEITGAQEGTRTPTPDKGKRILSPPRLPFRHLGNYTISSRKLATAYLLRHLYFRI